MIRTIQIRTHDRDTHDVTLLEDGVSKRMYYGYSPPCLPGGGGDDLEFQIDLGTGRILNWDVDKIKAWIDRGMIGHEVYEMVDKKPVRVKFPKEILEAEMDRED